MYSSAERTAFVKDPQLLEYMVFIVIIIFYFFERMRFSLTRPLYQTVNFWISVGLFVYFSGSFFYILLVEDFFRKSHRILMEFRQISTAIVLLKNLVLSFAVCVKEMPEETGEYEFNIPLDMNLDSFESFTPKNNLN
jgi:glucan phosphoethanolaminetransferase (alkaline phosphatase superfamily)